MKKTSVLKKEHDRFKELVMDDALYRLRETLFLWPEVEFSLTELAEKANVSKSTASGILEVLTKHGIVKVVDKNVVLRIRANRESFDFIKRKIAFNLESIYQTTLIEILKIKLENPKSIILFGSFRWGQDISTSDIDIAVEVAKEIDLEIVSLEQLGFKGKIIEHYELHFGNRKIHVHMFNRKRIDLNVFNSIANGIILSGFLEVNP